MVGTHSGLGGRGGGVCLVVLGGGDLGKQAPLWSVQPGWGGGERVVWGWVFGGGSVAETVNAANQTAATRTLVKAAPTEHTFRNEGASNHRGFLREP